MDYIRKHYKVPAKRFGRVFLEFLNEYGTIVGAKDCYIRIRLDGEKKVGSYHPTWNVKYL